MALPVSLTTLDKGFVVKLRQDNLKYIEENVASVILGGFRRARHPSLYVALHEVNYY